MQSSASVALTTITPSQAAAHASSCPLPPAILLNVLGWFPSISCCSTLASAPGINNRHVALGTAHHTPFQLSPALPTAKLDPPTLQSIQSIPFQTDCIALAWDVARGTEHMELQCELRYRAPEDPAWVLVSAAGAVGLGRSGDPPSAPSSGSATWEWDGKVSPRAHTRASLCPRQEPAQPLFRLPPGHRHHRPGRHRAALRLPLWHTVPLPDAVPAELSIGTGLLERVEPGQELHHPRER